MKAEKYLDRTLAKYCEMYDIHQNYRFAGETFPAYAYFSQQNEKYVLTRKAQLWQVKGYEHILFVITDRMTDKEAAGAKKLMDEHMAPELVCKGEKYPEKDHMVSYLTVVFLSEKTPDAKAQHAIAHFRYDKGYLFSFRGHVEGRLLCVDMEAEDVYTNFTGRVLKESFMSTFREVENGLKGYSELDDADEADETGAQGDEG